MEGSEGELREAHGAGLARGTRVDRQAGPLAKEPLGGQMAPFGNIVLGNFLNRSESLHWTSEIGPSGHRVEQRKGGGLHR